MTKTAIDTTAISNLLHRATDAGDVPGVVAAVATMDGPVFEAASGKRSLAGDAPMTTDTIVRIASMTKAITGACAMQLVEQGKLDLDSPIGAVVPELVDVKVLEGYDAAGKPKLRAPKRPLTLRHLLTHTSGHVYDTWNADITRYRKYAGLPGTDSGLNAALSIPLMFDPGERWEYGIGIDWAGKAVEAASGMKLGRYMKQHIFDPLGMVDSGFQLNDAQQPRRAALHLRGADGLEVVEREPPKNPEYEAGGGGLFSTVGDYLKFAQMMLHKGRFNGAQILKPETVALMSRNAMGDTNVRALKTAIPQRSNDVDFIDGMKWSLTFLVNQVTTPQGRSPGSLAWAGLMNSYYWIDPAKGITGVLATQILPFCDIKALKLFEDFETAVYKTM
jgi:CubicO group peptidase (beta-lactamase class C family)